MKAYSKPMAELENFSLDGEFASGACAVIPDEVKAKYEDTFTGTLENVKLELYELQVGGTGIYWLEPIAAYNNIPYDTFINMDPDSAEFISAVDNYTMYQINNSADDLNSGFCYFTFGAGDGKTFS